MRYLTFVSVVTNAIMVLLLGIGPSTVHAEATEVRLSRQYGLGYLPLMVMEHDKLIEKHASASGLGDVNVAWITFAGGSIANDALLSGNVDFAGGGIGAFITLWEKSKGTVKSPGALSSYPMYLNTTNSRVRSIKDLTEKDRIALPAPKISPQAVTLQAAAAQTWGDSAYGKLDAMTIGLGHPDAMQALLSGASEIDAHFTTPPFQYEELKDPKVHTILNSNDVWGGALTANILWASAKFVDQNPRLYKAVVEALDDAVLWINTNRTQAAALYLSMTKEKSSNAEILAMINDPDIQFTQTPQNLIKFVDFKLKTGTLKSKPDSWKDFFFPNVWIRNGS